MGNNHLQWFDESKRKVLVISFDKYYLEQISKHISNKDIKIDDSIGFKSDDVEYNKFSIRLWYLTIINRHLWKHHFIGSQGVILNFSFQKRVKDSNIIFEVMNVLNDQNLYGVPILLVFDINNKEKALEENLMQQMKKEFTEDRLNMIKCHYVDFQNNINELKTGFDWLCENMKPLK